jgi:hypothetical protein
MTDQSRFDSVLTHEESKMSTVCDVDVYVVDSTCMFISSSRDLSYLSLRRRPHIAKDYS